MRKHYGFIVAIVLVAMTMMSACGHSGQSIDTEDAIQEPDKVAIKTPLGILYMPDTWKESLKTKVEKDGEIVHFFTELDNNTYPLFDVIITEKDEHQGEGLLKGPDGVVRNVSVILADQKGIEKLPLEQQDQFYAMQEDINYLIDHLD